MHLDFLGLDFLGLAYAVTAIVLAWDYLAPRIRLARVLRAITRRGHRDAARAAHTAPSAGEAP